MHAAGGGGEAEAVVAESHREHPSAGVLAMDLRSDLSAQTLVPQPESVQRPGTLKGKRFRAAPWAPMFWKPGCPPGLSRFVADQWLVGPEQDLLGCGD
jgi:hypothetical protein